MLKLIVCLDRKNGIGKNNRIPWNVKDEMLHFKNTTLNHIVVMGRKTYESIGKPLPNRRNIILTKNKDYKINDDVEICYDYKEILNLAMNKDVFIIGGSEIYSLFKDYYDELIISRLNDEYDCDTFFKVSLDNYELVQNEHHTEFKLEYYRPNKKILDGKRVASYIKNQLIIRKDKLIQEYGKKPHLVIIQVGNDFASSIYIKNKMKLADEIGTDVSHISLDNVTQSEVIELIHKLNKNDNVSGILIQKPLPKEFDEHLINSSIDPNKDVDCFNPINVGKLWTQFQFDEVNHHLIIPCTPAGIIELIDYYKINLEGKDVVIVGRSNIVSKPLASLFICRNATVQICHSRTNDLKEKCKKADIIVTAIGKPKFINADYIKDGAIVIDVGINRGANNKICGDVDFDNVLNKVDKITPVPGGIGPLTLVMLFENLLDCLEKQMKNR